MKFKSLILLFVSAIISLPSIAADYDIDNKGAHAFVNFRIQHLGYSWLYGRFNTFSGHFSFDEKDMSKAKVEVVIDTASIDSNHAKRDKHLRSPDFLDTDKFPKATFTSTKITKLKGSSFKVVGNLTLHGVTKEVTIEATKVGEGKDPWGGYRAGFHGTTKIALADFNIPTKLGPASTHVELDLNIEGIKRK